MRGRPLLQQATGPRGRRPAAGGLREFTEVGSGVSKKSGMVAMQLGGVSVAGRVSKSPWRARACCGRLYFVVSGVCIKGPGIVINITGASGGGGWRRLLGGGGSCSCNCNCAWHRADEHVYAAGPGIYMRRRRALGRWIRMATGRRASFPAGALLPPGSARVCGGVRSRASPGVPQH